MKNVPEMISTKDSAYIKDMFNWNFVAMKKFDDYLKIVFISRISPQKNLLGAIKSLKNVKINIKFSIYGPLEDLDYWKKCELRLEKMPNNIKWK